MRYVIVRLKSGQYAVCSETGRRYAVCRTKPVAARKKALLESRDRKLRRD